MMDAFTSASWTGQRARATCVRDRSAPIVMPRDLAGHMPDPRVAPFDARTVRSGFIIRTIAQAVVCAVPVILMWVIL